jgi:ketosteroid isomerase-like protein
MTTQTTEEMAVADAAEAFRKAMIAADRSQFEILCADQLSYGHSGGSLETKAEFIAANTDGISVWKYITLSDQTIRVVGDTALVRHILTGETEREGKTYPIQIGILLVWQKQASNWRLLARQAYKF